MKSITFIDHIQLWLECVLWFQRKAASYCGTDYILDSSIRTYRQTPMHLFFTSVSHIQQEKFHYYFIALPLLGAHIFSCSPTCDLGKETKLKMLELLKFPEKSTIALPIHQRSLLRIKWDHFIQIYLQQNFPRCCKMISWGFWFRVHDPILHADYWRVVAEASL